MRDMPNPKTKAARHLARLTKGAPLLSAVSVPWAEVQIGMIDEMETLFHEWCDLRRNAVRHFEDSCHAVAREGGDTGSALREMAVCSTAMAKCTADALRHGTEAWVRSCGLIATGMANMAAVSARTAQVITPEETGNHSTPL